VYQGPISPTVCEKLLRAQIPKEQKDTDDFTIIFALLGSELVKQLIKHW